MKSECKKNFKLRFISEKMRFYQKSRYFLDDDLLIEMINIHPTLKIDNFQILILAEIFLILAEFIILAQIMLKSKFSGNTALIQCNINFNNYGHVRLVPKNTSINFKN